MTEMATSWSVQIPRLVVFLYHSFFPSKSHLIIWSPAKHSAEKDLACSTGTTMLVFLNTVPFHSPSTSLFVLVLLYVLRPGWAGNQKHFPDSHVCNIISIKHFLFLCLKMKTMRHKTQARIKPLGPKCEYNYFSNSRQFPCKLFWYLQTFQTFVFRYSRYFTRFGLF